MNRTWKTWQLLVASGVALVLGVGAGGSGTDEALEDERRARRSAEGLVEELRVEMAEFRNTTVPRVTTTREPPSTRPAPTTTTTEAGPKTSFGNGTHRVGTGIAPGTYSSPGGSSCYWARLSGFGGTLGEILANSAGRDSQVVTILPSDAGFETRGCGTWTQG